MYQISIQLMRILLLGEYSRLHLTLAEGLRKLGHEVVVASDGDGHKSYPRDIDLTRKSSGIIDTVSAFYSINKKFKSFKEFDVVQLINPCFLTLSVGANKYFFDKLKGNNKKIFLGAFGDDYYWVKACRENKIFKYSEFFVDGRSTNLDYNKLLEKRWIGSSREKLNKYIASKCDGIVACLYEYYKSYEPYYQDKLKYIPLPIHIQDLKYKPIESTPDVVRFFIGIDKMRSEYKGTDLLYKVLLEFEQKYKNEVKVLLAQSVTFEEYTRLMFHAHVLVDQLYSHSPSVNPLQAMAQGKVVVSGAEPEMYDLMGDVTNRPIINVYPTEEGIWNALEYILKNKDRLPSLSQQSRIFVEQYHDSVDIAQQYLDFWMSR